MAACMLPVVGFVLLGIFGYVAPTNAIFAAILFKFFKKATAI